MSEANELRCVICGHTWASKKRSGKPKRCPNPSCTSWNWEIGRGQKKRGPKFKATIIEHSFDESITTPTSTAQSEPE